MSRDVWAERRELLEYVLKEHARRGGRVVAAPQTALFEPRVLDQLNITALVKQLQHGGILELARVMLPASPLSANGPGPGDLVPVNSRMPSGSVAGSSENPFGQTQAALSASVSMGSLGGENPFVQNPTGPRHAPHASGENPFSVIGGGGSVVSGGGGGGGVGASGGGGANPFHKPPARPSNGSISAADSAIFGKKKGSLNGGGSGGAAVGSTGEPPVTTLSTTTKLSYSTTATSSPQRNAPSLIDRSSRRRADVEGAAVGPQGEATEGAVLGPLQPPRLDLPQLETGQTDDQLRNLAYLLFAAVAGGTGNPQDNALLPLMRQQLLIDEAHAMDVSRVLKHLQPGGEPHLIDQPHPVFNGGGTGGVGGWRPSQRASLELLLRLISVVRPSDFEAVNPAKVFQGFLRWKDVTVAVLERQVSIAVAAGWTGDNAQLKKMLARMHGAARRADVRGEADYDDDEYGEATSVFANVAGQLLAGCSTVLKFPWAVRVRLCEILVTALFDTMEAGFYIDEASLIVQFLDCVFFPALGLSPSAAQAVNAWVHFSMYVGTGCKEQRLVKYLKQQISKLATAAAEAPLRGSDPFGLALDGAPAPALAEELSRDSALASQVANHIVDWVYGRLCGYHVAFPRGENLAALLDVFVFACKSRGDGPQKLAELLVEAVCQSATSSFQQQMRARMDPGAPNEARLLEMASIVHDIHDADANTFCPALAPHVPAALAVAAVQMHILYGQYLAPWLSIPKTISPAVLDVFRTAHVLERRLTGPITISGGGGAATRAVHPPAVTEVLSSFRRWDLSSPLKATLLQWVEVQVSNMTTWTARALQTEKWKPMGSGSDAAHTSSAAEVSRMTMEALDALYGMDVPMPSEVPQALLEGIDAVMRKYVTHVNEKLGALQRLIPPVPQPVRYKKDIAMKNELLEREAGRNSVKGGKGKMAFLSSVPTVESSPDFTNVSASLTPETLIAAACSMHYLYGRAEALVQVARERQLQSTAAHCLPPPQPASTAGSAGCSPAKSEGSSSIGEAPEPLLHARTSLITGMQYACKFLATRIVFWDQRTPWLELLYRHHVTMPASRIEPVLDGLHKVLAATCPGLPDAVRTAFAKHLMVASVQAAERILLDGGPCRWFMPADVQAIDQDMHKLRALFYAAGDGLDRELIDSELERVQRLLPLMRVEVGPLMDMLKTARTHGTAQLMAPSGGPGNVYDESTILRVLVHRPERNGSKMLKSWYKLPKKPK